MITCAKCGSENKNDAKYCNGCGKKLQFKDDFDKNIENFSSEMENIGKRIEKKFEGVEKNFDNWYDKTFGPVGPFISSIIGIIVFVIIIKFLGFFGNNSAWMQDIGKFFEDYILFFIIFIVFSNYTSYLSKKYKKFKWFSPAVGSLGFAFSFWVLLNVFKILGDHFNIGFLTSPIIPSRIFTNSQPHSSVYVPFLFS